LSKEEEEEEEEKKILEYDCIVSLRINRILKQ